LPLRHYLQFLIASQEQEASLAANRPAENRTRGITGRETINLSAPGLSETEATQTGQDSEKSERGRLTNSRHCEGISTQAEECSFPTLFSPMGHHLFDPQPHRRARGREKPRSIGIYTPDSAQKIACNFVVYSTLP
jgi:hypothetical protein